MRWKRYRTPFSVMVIDLNGFKQINDTWGHAFGDLALCSLAKHLSECCREVDEVCRIGGDEFALLLPHTGPNGAQVLADRMAATLPQLPNPTLGGPPIKLVASFGIAATDAGVPDAEHMMHAADAAMYDSKRGQALSQRKSSI
jgi:diguanylate cyclase (GGDEF)-like protein